LLNRLTFVLACYKKVEGAKKWKCHNHTIALFGRAE
jgi:hypothetical protein